MYQPEPRIAVVDRREHYARVSFNLIDDPRIKDSKTIALYVALGRFADFGTGGCWPTRRNLMDKARIGNKQTFYRCIENLLRAGWLKRFRNTARPNQTTVYELTLAKLPRVEKHRPATPPVLPDGYFDPDEKRHYTPR